MNPAPTGSFDASTGIVHFGAETTLYGRAHEYAHQTQQRYRTRAWRLDSRIGGLPYLGRFTRLWVEWEAARLALKALKSAGRLDRASVWEARAGVWTYVRALLVFWS